MMVEATIALLVAAAWLARWLWKTRRGDGSTRLPAEMRSAELVFSERLFHATTPIVISAKVDRVYRRCDGVFVLLELKTRSHARIYPSDVIELSAQRVALLRDLGQPVAGYGYVLIQDSSGRQLACRRVRLLSESSVARLAARRRNLLAGVDQPVANGAPHLCRSCPQRPLCGRSA
ncbi:MAG: PD-(D/E)XK nuclease family protein [Acidovorax sp.]